MIQALASVGRGLAVLAALVGGLAVYGLLTGEVATILPDDRPVLMHFGARYYVTVGCGTGAGGAAAKKVWQAC
jgi:hypothetical protein